ncbi:MAG: CBS and ACT domain-containing protein [bacterium]
MLVKDWMSKEVITIDEDDSMRMAIKLMKEYKIRSLPVMKKGKLVGILSNGDIKRASASDATSLEIHEMKYLIDKILIRDIMVKHPITASPLQTVDEVADLLLKENISSAPVLDNAGNLIGIITKSDILKVMVSLSGSNRRGIDFGFEIPDAPGSIKEITDIFRSYGGRLASILISYRQAPAGSRHVYIRVYHVNRRELEALKSDLFSKFKVLYMIDYIEQSREVF